MTVHPALLKAGATVPHLIASALISLVLWACLPATIGLGVLIVWLVVSGALAFGFLEGTAVRLLWHARPPSPAEASALASAWQQATTITDLTRLHLWVGGTAGPAFAAGPHHLVLAQRVVDHYRAGRLTRDDIGRLILNADGRRRRGYPRFDLLLAFWTWPWDLIRGFLLGVGRLLRWIPLVGFAWRIRFVVAAVAVTLETQEGRAQTALIIATFITLTYLTPACRRSWEQHLTGAASAFAARHSKPTATAPTAAR